MIVLLSRSFINEMAVSALTLSGQLGIVPHHFFHFLTHIIIISKIFNKINCLMYYGQDGGGGGIRTPGPDRSRHNRFQVYVLMTSWTRLQKRAMLSFDVINNFTVAIWMIRRKFFKFFNWHFTFFNPIFTFTCGSVYTFSPFENFNIFCVFIYFIMNNTV